MLSRFFCLRSCVGAQKSEQKKTLQMMRRASETRFRDVLWEIKKPRKCDRGLPFYVFNRKINTIHLTKTTIPYESGIILKEKWRFRAIVGTFWQQTAGQAWEHFTAILRRKNGDSVWEWEQFDKQVTISLRSGAIFEWETKTTIPCESGNYS